MKVYALLWKYNHRGEFDAGVSLHTDKKQALNELKDCYEQAIHNITPNGTKEELDTDEYSEGETCYYYVERYPADSWESGEILEREI